MDMEPDESEAEDSGDDWCPECFGDEVIYLPDSGQWYCTDCRVVIEY